MKEKKEIEKICAYCEHSRDTQDSEYLICSKNGIVHAMYKCRKFVYDPIKRSPKSPAKNASVLEYVDLGSNE